ncbi:MAG: Coenzyme F420-0:L-glutamate ligase @ F420-1:L-glutamate ligase [uncultured Chloroflexi bacterium]|uniref:Coenzyme F420-0:L-glutamate ligase @ F420-1:L-glutamate ligase n=1 Tax=uncultured Chloroflexota bacterium TaxID=166587 RepID=A0A6J4K652_9CHLR|nr:MAG: Coenzyme F420-0:L-glutamate ligase @ F420-1:L-glutamate ligase [uncultured Chloroflexota bacterium]
MFCAAAVRGLPEVRPGDDLVALLLEALSSGGCELAPLHDADVVVFTSKAVSKAEGRLVRLDDVTPSPFATTWAAANAKDPRQVEVVLREARRIVRMDRGVLIAETHHGVICANAGVDASNAPSTGTVMLLPQDPDASARALRCDLTRRAGVDVTVLISDTFGRPWRTGQTNVAIGASGIAAVHRYDGHVDPIGYTLKATEIAVADELAAAAELVMGKLDRVPVAIARGAAYTHLAEDDPDPGAAALVRAPGTDMFR